MAEEEVIILEEDEDKEKSASSAEESADVALDDQQDEQRDDRAADDESQRGGIDKKKLYLLIGLGALIVLLTILLVVVLVNKKNEKAEKEIDPAALAKKIRSSERKKRMPKASEIENMIKKANLLYSRGNKKEALRLFEQIAEYSASLSHYNLGVVQMRQGRYEAAIASFKKAIANGENRTVSAINAATSALHLKDYKRFKYYLDMAEASLPDEYGSSIYSYLYAIVNYYKGNYYEVLAALAHPTSKHYLDETRRLGGVGYSVFGDTARAIGLFESHTRPSEFTVLGELYARHGDYAMAETYLKKAVAAGHDDPVLVRKALALVELKNGLTQQSANYIKELIEHYKQKNRDDYFPVKVFLSPDVYDIDAAQKNYASERLVTPPNAYKLLFEFAPYKVFNATQTINYIKKGNASIYVDESPEAARYLSKSSSISHVNILISQAIGQAIEHRLRKANRLLQKALKRYPSHAILHYNLGLTYAQLGNYSKAYQHFLRSYHLNTNLHLSAIFALTSGHLIGKRTPMVEKFLSEDLGTILDPTTPQLFHQTLFNLYRNNLPAAQKWLAKSHDNRPVYLLTDILTAAAFGNWEKARSSAKKLRDRLPDDVMANILYLRVKTRTLDVKQFSIQAQQYLKHHPVDLNAVFYGSTFTRENYIALRFVTGTLYRFKKLAEKRMLENPVDPAGVIESLALGNIYLQDFEEAYVLLNQLVDKYGMDDSRTLFLSAVAAIGAEHYANAIALLELAKLTDPDNMESRYALGLLYLQRHNLEAAAIQFGKIPDGTFRSKYFDFDVAGYKR